VVVVRLGAALVDHGGDAVLAARVQEHPVHGVVAGAARPEVEICVRGEQARAVRQGLLRRGRRRRKKGGRRGRLAVGVLEGEVVADEPATGGAEDDDVAAGGHGGDDAVAPRRVALQGVHGEQLTAGGVHRQRAGRRRCEFGLRRTDVSRLPTRSSAGVSERKRTRFPWPNT
jgi:hypothetical protein